MVNKADRGAPLSSIAVRSHNRRLLLQLLRANGAISRRELSVLSGLSPAAVTNVVSDLLEADLVVDGQPAKRSSGAIGRPSSLVSLASDRNFVLAAQIGAGVVQVGLADLGARLLASDQAAFPLPARAPEVLNLVATMLRRIIDDAAVPVSRILGLGVGAAGLVDLDRRVNLSSQNLGWADVNVADFFEEELGVAVVVDHNVRTMAAAEARYGVGQGLESLVFIYIRTGVGAGLILGGQEYRGGTHGAAEVGHMRVDPRGRACSCGGKGCLETVLSDAVIQERMVQLGLLPEPPSANDRTWSQVLVDRVESGDEAAVALRDEIVEHTAAALLNIINLLNPEVIVLGGLLFELAPIILGPLRQTLPGQVLPLLRDRIRIEPAFFGLDAGVVGAATVALDQFVFGELVLDTARAS